MKKTSEVSPFKETNVSNQINMNLNQNDLIDVVIENQVEILSKKLEQLDEKIEQNQNAEKEIVSTLLKKVLKTVSNPTLTTFQKICKQFNLVVNDTTSFGFNNPLEDRVTVKIVDLDHVEQYKDPLSYAKRNYRDMTIYFSELINIRLDYNGGLPNLGIHFSTSMPGEESIKNEYKTLMKPVLKERIALHEEKYKTSLEYLEYKYGEKKIKAKIVKASLKKSPEGLAILQMLEGATNIKLLG